MNGGLLAEQHFLSLSHQGDEEQEGTWWVLVCNLVWPLGRMDLNPLI